MESLRNLNNPPRNDGRYDTSSKSGIESSNVIHPTKNMRVYGLMTVIRSCNKGTNLAREKAVVLVSCSFESPDGRRIETYVEADSETISLTKRSSNSAPFLTDSSWSAASWYVLDGGVSE